MHDTVVPTRDAHAGSAATLTDDARWEIVRRRDRSMRDAFVLGVVTTGIYCRPGCPARMPLRRNVRFFGTNGAAEAAGFRACKRCRPRDGAAPSEASIARVCRYIAAHLDTKLTLARLGRVAGISPFHFQRRFVATMGITPRQYADALRLDAFRRALREGRPVLDAVVEAGYGSTSRLYDRSTAHLGMTPTGYRAGGAHQAIAFAVEDTALGPVLIAATDRGICAIRIGEPRAQAIASLHDEFPRAACREDRSALSHEREVVRALASGRSPESNLPLDVRATAFQHQVWTALARIPRGETRSYRDIAQAIGRPRAVRAVANACASNPVALLIPCHRVVRSDGEHGGYRWGADRKSRLLEAESAHPTARQKA